MSIIGKLPHSFPKHLTIEDQGRFAIGYYQQRENYFKTGTETTETVTESN
jgi:CRISPR-associated protein Csd1